MYNAQLYIPIWLYSNSVSNDSHCVAFNFTFQSGYIQIMSGLILKTSYKTLHSNLVIFKFLIFIINSLANILYIPIWLYSNFAGLCRREQTYNFTFQSGYIQISLNISFRVVTKFFTFQSGYIQIPTSRISCKMCIVFTFQSGYIQIKYSRVCQRCTVYLYIPIWLYSNMSVQSLINSL